MELTKKELLNIVGGGLTASMLNAFIRGVNTILDLGRSVGSGIRRISNGSLCSV